MDTKLPDSLIMRCTPSCWEFVAMQGESPTLDVTIDSPDGIPRAWEVAPLPPNVSVWPSSGISPSVVTIQIQTKGMPLGPSIFYIDVLGRALPYAQA